MLSREVRIRSGNELAIDVYAVDRKPQRCVQWVATASALGIEISRLALSPVAISIEGSAPSIQTIEGLGERIREQGWAVQSDSPGRTPEGRQQFILKGAVSHEG